MKLPGPFLLPPLCMLISLPLSAGQGDQLKTARTLQDYKALAGWIEAEFTKPEAHLQLVYALEAAGVACQPGAPVRRAIVNDLTRLLEGTADVVRASVISRLPYSFVEADFDEAAAERVLARYKAAPANKAAILAAGMAAFPRVKTELAVLAEGELKEPDAGRYYGTPEWAALLILARNGDKPSVERIVRAANAEKDIVVKSTVLVKDLQLVPQKDVIGFLAQLAKSDERLPQVKATGLGEPVANRAILTLSTMLVNPPALRDPSVPTEAERKAFRAWLSKPSNLKIKPVSAK